MTGATTKHTPGPWTVVHNYRGKLAIVGPKNDRHRTDYDRIANLPHRRNGEGEANAKLIAAAPRLAEALKRLADHFEGSVAALPEFGYGRAIIADARAALEEAGL